MKINKVHEDDRGKIFVITGEELGDIPEVTMLMTNKGYARGGCVHNDADEYSTVISGIVRFYIGDDIPELLRDGMSIMMPKGTPHCLVAQTDSIILEWGTRPENTTKDENMRKQVEECNARN